MTDRNEDIVLHVPARDIPAPTHLSAGARGSLRQPPPLSPTLPLDDKAAWREYVQAFNASMMPMLEQMVPLEGTATVEERHADGVRLWDIKPAEVKPGDRGIVLELHGGGLLMCGGELCRTLGIVAAARYQRRSWAVDYHMPPDHPYPASLDDCIAAYRALLRERLPSEIIISGGSAGGNLAAALLLRAKDEGLPMPAGLILVTPEVDLTESGDSFRTNDGIDPTLRSLMQWNLLYAGGQELTHPYLSPLFGDVSGFPPTLLTTGTRDLYLSNTVRMHRKLRAAGVPAELHVLEAAGHGGFFATPEGAELDQELRRFVAEVLGECPQPDGPKALG